MLVRKKLKKKRGGGAHCLQMPNIHIHTNTSTLTHTQCVGVGEVFYNRYIVKKDLFKGVMKLLQNHLHRNNLVCLGFRLRV